MAIGLFLIDPHQLLGCYVVGVLLASWTRQRRIRWVKDFANATLDVVYIGVAVLVFNAVGPVSARSARGAQHRRVRRGDDRGRLVRLPDRAQRRHHDRAGPAQRRRGGARVPLPGHRDHHQCLARDRGADDPDDTPVARLRAGATGDPRARRTDRRRREPASCRPQRVPLPHHRDPALDPSGRRARRRAAERHHQDVRRRASRARGDPGGARTGGALQLHRRRRARAGHHVRADLRRAGGAQRAAHHGDPHAVRWRRDQSLGLALAERSASAGTVVVLRGLEGPQGMLLLLNPTRGRQARSPRAEPAQHRRGPDQRRARERPARRGDPGDVGREGRAGAPGLLRPAHADRQPLALHRDGRDLAGAAGAARSGRSP